MTVSVFGSASIKIEEKVLSIRQHKSVVTFHQILFSRPVLICCQLKWIPTHHELSATAWFICLTLIHWCRATTSYPPSSQQSRPRSRQRSAVSWPRTWSKMAQRFKWVRLFIQNRLVKLSVCGGGAMDGGLVGERAYARLSFFCRHLSIVIVPPFFSSCFWGLSVLKGPTMTIMLTQKPPQALYIWQRHCRALCFLLILFVVLVPYNSWFPFSPHRINAHFAFTVQPIILSSPTLKWMMVFLFLISDGKFYSFLSVFSENCACARLVMTLLLLFGISM